MEQKQEQPNHNANSSQALKQDPDKPLSQVHSEQSRIDYFVPPPINYLNSQYYQHLQGSDNPMRHLTNKFICLDQQISVNGTPPDIPVERPITLKLKEELSQRNRDIYLTMLKILANEGRLSIEESMEGLQIELKTQMQQFLEVCARAKVAEMRYLTLQRMQAETVSISKRTEVLKSQLQQIKAELGGDEALKQEDF